MSTEEHTGRKDSIDKRKALLTQHTFEHAPPRWKGKSEERKTIQKQHAAEVSNNPTRQITKIAISTGTEEIETNPENVTHRTSQS